MSYTRAYHYTMFPLAVLIVHSGVIRLSFVPKGSGDLTAVWFSTNPVWDAGMGVFATDKKTGKTRELGFKEIAEKMGIARFSTDAATLIPLVVALRDKPDLFLSYARTAARIGSDVAQWFVDLEPVTLAERCTGAELWLEGEWVDLTSESAGRMYRALPNGTGASMAQLCAPTYRKRVPKKRKRKR